MKMNKHEQKALISLAECIISHKHDQPGLQELARLALAALTEEPVKVLDEATGGDAPSHLDEYEATCWVAGACWMREKILSRLSAIDNTSQQYEALAKEASND